MVDVRWTVTLWSLVLRGMRWGTECGCGGLGCGDVVARGDGAVVRLTAATAVVRFVVVVVVVVVNVNDGLFLSRLPELNAFPFVFDFGSLPLVREASRVVSDSVEEAEGEVGC